MEVGSSPANLTMHLVLSSTTHGRIQVEKRDGERLIAREATRFQSDKDFRQGARTLGVDRSMLLEAIDRYQREGVTEFPIETNAAPLSIWIRPRLGTEKVGYDSLDSALSATDLPSEPLICWNDAGQLAALDVDLHGTERRSDGELTAWLCRAKPEPRWVWITHGGGLRLMYLPVPPYQANELAAVAAVSLASIMPEATFEIKTVTRHPKREVNGRHCGGVLEQVQSADLSAVASWIGEKEASPEAIEEWLESKGLQIGRRYPHSQCPEQPEERGERDPVVVQAEGVYCHACAARGVKKGWFPFSVLCGSAIAGPLRQCITGLCHWEHAKHVLNEHAGLSGEVARLAYSAVCKVAHPDDGRVSSLTSAGRNLLRFEGRWVTELGETYTKDLRAVLATLPACQSLDGSANMERISRFNQPIDLSEYGYPALTPVWGCRIYSHRLPLHGGTSVVIPTKPYANDTTFRPHYRKVRDVEAAWGAVEEVFPGVTRSLIELLIAAKGVSEGGVAMPPMIFISGPTSSAKTSSVSLAAAICADHNSAVVWTGNIERVRQSVQDGKDEGSFITFNEILKASVRAGETFTQTLDFLLNLTGDSRSHKLYVGSVRLGTVPVCVWTDTDVPCEVRQDAQLARRLVHVHLSHQVDWRDSFKNSGVGRAERFRLTDKRYADACDVILSDVIDRFFDQPRTFEEIAGVLGYKTMLESAEAAESEEVLRRFYKAWKTAPELDGADARNVGDGFKLIRREEESDLANLWLRICDKEAWDRSRRCTEVEWRRLVGDSVTFDTRYFGGQKLFVRFQ